MIERRLTPRWLAAPSDPQPSILPSTAISQRDNTMRLPILSSVALLALPLATSALSVQSLIDVATTSVYTATGIDVGGIYKKLSDSLSYQDAEDVRDGVVRLTDGNYDELVVNEQLTEAQEKERVWCVVV